MVCRSILLLALVALVATAASDTHPECAWTCDNPSCGGSEECTWSCGDPRCSADCYPQCALPDCQVVCSSTRSLPRNVDCDPPVCQTQCPPTVGMDIKNSCPTCETLCSPPVCRNAGGAECTVLCAATACEWICERPAHCDSPLCSLSAACGGTCSGGAPQCELQCEAPACQGVPRVSSGASTAGVAIAAIFAIFLI